MVSNLLSPDDLGLVVDALGLVVDALGLGALPRMWLSTLIHKSVLKTLTIISPDDFGPVVGSSVRSALPRMWPTSISSKHVDIMNRIDTNETVRIRQITAARTHRVETCDRPDIAVKITSEIRK